MKDNNEFVGVDEQYIPNDERYSSYDEKNDAMAGMREDINDGYNKVRDYMQDDKNRKKIKRKVTRTAKLAKGLFALYIILVIFVFVFVIGGMIFGFMQMKKMSDSAEETKKEGAEVATIVDESSPDVDLSDEVATGIENIPDVDDVNDKVESAQAEGDKALFNSMYEFYSGTQSGSSVSFMLDNLVEDGNNGEHIIEVNYGDVSTTNPDEISGIADSFEAFTEYNVELGYDEAGYVNIITITDK